MSKRDPVPIHPQPIAGQSLLTFCGSTSVARSKYAKGGREGGKRTFKIQQKEKAKTAPHCTLPPYAPVGRNVTAEGGKSTYSRTSDVRTIVIIVVIDRSC